MGFLQCQVCQEAQSKYKCPSCLLPYCSLVCFKRHKENPCNKSAPQEEKISIVPPERSIEVDETKWILGSEQLQFIAESTGVRDALKDIELQKLVYKIDSSSNPEEELDKAMDIDGFLRFKEEILLIVSPNERALKTNT